MWKEHGFERIFTDNDVLNIKDRISKGFSSKERAYSMGINYYFGPIQTNRPHATPSNGPGKYKSEVDYYRQKYCSPGKVAHIRKNCKNQFNT